MILWGNYRAGLDPDFAGYCDATIGPQIYTYAVTSGRRDEAEEDALYAQGRTTPGPIVTWAKPGDSAHEKGLAIDVVPIVSGERVWNTEDPAWQTLVTAVRASPHLHSGADFPKGETDYPHIERVNWRMFCDH